jgi:hypothetical protein
VIGFGPPLKIEAAGEAMTHVGRLVDRLEPDEGLAAEHEGAQVEALLAVAVGGHPRLVGLDEDAQGLEEVLGRQLREDHPARAGLEALGVLVRAEGPDRAVLVAVGLEALEDLGGVVQHRGGRGDGDVAVCRELTRAPALTLTPGRPNHVVGHELAEARRGEDLGATLGRHGAGVRGGGERQGHGGDLPAALEKGWASLVGVGLRLSRWCETRVLRSILGDGSTGARARATEGQ